MSRLKPKEIKSMKPQEKENKIKELKFELAKVQANAAQNPSKKKEIKKTIARLLTVK